MNLATAVQVSIDTAVQHCEVQTSVARVWHVVVVKHTSLGSASIRERGWIHAPVHVRYFQRPSPHVEFIDFCVRVHVRLARRSWVVRLDLFLQSLRC